MSKWLEKYKDISRPEKHRELIVIENLISEIRERIKLLDSEFRALQRIGVDPNDPELKRIIKNLESLRDYLNILIERRIYIEGKYK